MAGPPERMSYEQAAQLQASESAPTSAAPQRMSYEQAAQLQSAPVEPTYGSEALRIAGQIPAGITKMGGLVADVAELNPILWPYHAGKKLLTGSSDFGFDKSAKADEIASEYFPRPETPTGRVLGKGAEFLSTAPIPIGGLGLKARALTDFMGGIGAGVAEEKGAGATGQLLGGMAGSLTPSGARGVKNMWTRFNHLRTADPSLVVPKAAEELQSLATNPKQSFRALNQTLGAPPVDDLAKFRTTAEVTQDPGLATLEKTISSVSKETVADYGARAKARGVARSDILDTLVKEAPLPKETSGSIIRDAMVNAETKVGKNVSNLYDAVDPGDMTRIGLAKAKRNVRGHVEKFLRSGVNKLDSETESLVGDFLQGPALKAGPRELAIDAQKQVTQRWAQDMRSRAMAIAKNPGKTPTQNRAASIARKVAEETRKAVNEAANSGKGFTLGQANMWGMARAGTKIKKRIFNTGRVEQVLKNDGYGNFKLPDSKVADVLMDGTSQGLNTTPETLRQVKEALTKQPYPLAVFRRSVVDKMILAAKNGDIKGPITFKSFTKTLEKNREGFKEIFDPEHFADLNTIQRDLVSAAGVDDLVQAASKGQSITGQKSNLLSAVQAFAARSMGVTGRIAHAGLKGAGAIGARVGDSVEDAIKFKLYQAAMEPEVARMLLSPATPTKVESIWKIIAKDSLESAARGGTREALEYNGNE